MIFLRLSLCKIISIVCNSPAVAQVDLSYFATLIMLIQLIVSLVYNLRCFVICFLLLSILGDQLT